MGGQVGGSPNYISSYQPCGGKVKFCFRTKLKLHWFDSKFCHTSKNQPYGGRVTQQRPWLGGDHDAHVHDVHGAVGVHGVTMSPAQGEPRPSGRRCPTTRHISERKQILLSEYGMLLQCTKTLTLYIALEWQTDIRIYLNDNWFVNCHSTECKFVCL